MIDALPLLPAILARMAPVAGAGDPAAFALSLAGLEGIAPAAQGGRQPVADDGKALPDREAPPPDVALFDLALPFFMPLAAPPAESRPVAAVAPGLEPAVSIAAHGPATPPVKPDAPAPRPVGELEPERPDPLDAGTAIAQPPALSPAPPPPVAAPRPVSTQEFEPAASPPPSAATPPAADEPGPSAVRRPATPPRARATTTRAPTAGMVEATTPRVDRSTDAPPTIVAPPPPARPALAPLPPGVRVVLPARNDDPSSQVAPDARPVRFGVDAPGPPPIGHPNPVAVEPVGSPIATRPRLAMKAPLPPPRFATESPPAPAQPPALPPALPIAHASPPQAAAPLAPVAAPSSPTQAASALEPRPVVGPVVTAIAAGSPVGDALDPIAPGAPPERTGAPAPERPAPTSPSRASPQQPSPGPLASRPVSGPAAQVFAGELRRAARDGRAPAGLDAGAATPPIAIEPTRLAIVQATAPSEPLDLRQADWPVAMIDRIERLRDAVDAADTRIRLVPDALGAIDVSVKREGETVHVHFTTEQAATRALLQDAAPRLAEAAEARGLKLGQTDMGGGGQQNGRHAPNGSHPLAPAPARTAEAADEDSTDTRIA